MSSNFTRRVGRCAAFSALGFFGSSSWWWTQQQSMSVLESTEQRCPDVATGAGCREHRVPVVYCAPLSSKPQVKAGQCIDGLPEYSEADVASHHVHKGGKTDVWVRYKCGVYDVSDFIAQHPGGVKRIMLAAGGSIERFWRQFTIHQEDSVRTILERHRIGNVKGFAGTTQSSMSEKEEAEAEEKLWANEPQRSPALSPLSQRPFNAETPEAALDDFITANDMFFVRNHMPVPHITAAEVEGRHGSFCLKVDGEGIIPRCLRLQELRELFPSSTVTSTIQCGGNRRSEMTAVHAAGGGGGNVVKGLSWSNGGIGTATWRGVWLRDVLRACQSGSASSDPHNLGRHVLMEGADKDAAGHFNVSVPYDLAMDPTNDCLIAYEMNGEPIPRDHGYPLRAIIPGTVGVRNCKWLQRLSVQNSESASVWQQQDYKNFPPYVSAPDPSLPSVYAMPVQGSLTDVSADDEFVVVKGYAYVGGGTGVQRVDVSFDGGKTFETQAPLLAPAPEVKPKLTPETRRDAWAWRQFQLQMPTEAIKAAPSVATLPTGDGDVQRAYRVCVKVTAADNASQPEVAPYNFRGLLYNGYSCRDAVLP